MDKHSKITTGPISLANSFASYYMNEESQKLEFRPPNDVQIQKLKRDLHHLKQE